MDACYCGKKLTFVESKTSFKCFSCQTFYHAACLKIQLPSQILGDIFYDFTCLKCAKKFGANSESLKRIKLSWLQASVLCMFNLEKKSDDGLMGYFNLNRHICPFIKQHWHDLFDQSFKKTKKLQDEVASTLSSYINVYFSSGLADLKQTGWWKLIPGVCPSRELLDSAKIKKRKQCEDYINIEDNKKLKFTKLNEEVSIDTDSASEEDGDDFIDVGDNISENEMNKESTQDMIEKSSSYISIDKSSDFKDELSYLTDTSSQDSSYKDSKRKKNQSIEWKTGKGLTVEEKVPEFFLKDDDDDDDEVLNEDAVNTSSLYELEDKNEDTKSNLPSLDQLFSSFEESQKQSQATVKHELKENTCMPSHQRKELIMMSRYDERMVLKKLQRLQASCHNLPIFNLFKTKLLLRQRKREFGLSIFNIDSYMRHLNKTLQLENEEKTPCKNEHTSCQKSELLDRYQHTKEHKEKVEEQLTLYQRFYRRHPRGIKSPYTNKYLKAYIRRDWNAKPLKMQLLQQIIAHHHRHESAWRETPSAPIDFVNVMPHHIEAINRLCVHFFWPDIDLTESLDYPDYGIVAQYKNLVVGFAFMIPDVNVDECYLSFVFVHPEWRKAGIAKFMLFYLFQLEPTKDVTLHVSISNHALFLYQKFCFKVEEFIENFYDKYLPFESTECRNAFFMRLKRFS